MLGYFDFTDGEFLDNRFFWKVLASGESVKGKYKPSCLLNRILTIYTDNRGLNIHFNVLGY